MSLPPPFFTIASEANCCVTVFRPSRMTLPEPRLLSVVLLSVSVEA